MSDDFYYYNFGGIEFMKKLFVILAMMLCLQSCGESNITDTSNASSSEAENTQSNITDTSNISSSEAENTQSTITDTTIQETNPRIYPLSYSSFADWKGAISPSNRVSLYEQLTKNGMEIDQINNVEFFIEKLNSQNAAVPYLRNDVIKLRNKEGYPTITFYFSELYGLPCLFYHPEVSTGENFYIKIIYLPDVIIESETTPVSSPTASDIIKKISPNSLKVNNPGEQDEKIYNQNIKLRDYEVEALIIEYKTSNRESIQFIYEGMLVEVRCDMDVWGEQWFSNLSFGDFEE